MPQIICANLSCGQHFYSKHAPAKYCSRRCAGIASMRIPEVQQRQRERMQKYSDQELLDRLTELSRSLGRTPYQRELCPGEWTYRHRFGSYNHAVVLAGLVPNVPLPRSYLDHERLSVPHSLRFVVLERDGFRCQYCGGSSQDGYTLHVDHRLPRSKGGKTDKENLITACSLCNRGKHDKLLAR